ncbi:MAG: hypothetical protein AAFN78_08555 [Pseudomonadota bacterium]
MQPLLLLFVSLLATPVFGQGMTEVQVGSRPGAGGPPDEVRVRFGLIDIVDVDDRRQRFSIDAFVEVHWRDRRLASSTVNGTEWRTLPVSDIWTPRLLILNNRGLQTTLPMVATVDGAGNVVLRQRLAGPLATDLELRDFPFDSQTLAIDIGSYQYSPSEVVFSSDSELIARTDAFRSKGWSFETLEPEHSVYRIAEDGRGTSLLRYSVRAQRKSVFYALTLALPMTLILFLAWLVHWMPPQVIPPRIGMSSATVFSLIALGVSFRLTLPAIDYLTRADRFVMLSTLLVAVSLAVTVFASSRASRDQLDVANRVSARMRQLFPVAYGLIVLATLIN